VLASLNEFEPYVAFKRIDREGSGYITPIKLSKFLKENGYRELEKQDMTYLIRYFDQEGSLSLNYHE